MIITIGNSKGGSGKTTLTTHIAAILAKKYRVLVIDMDDQANLTANFCKQGFPYPIDSRMLFDNPDSSIEPLLSDSGVEIIPAHPRLSEIDYREPLEAFRVIRMKMRPIATHYDFVFFDTPGSYSIRLASALAVSSKILIPLELTRYSLEALNKTKEIISNVSDTVNPLLNVGGIVPMKVKPLDKEGLPIRKKQREIYSQLMHTIQNLMWPPVRERESFSKAETDLKTILDVKPEDQTAIQDLNSIATKIENWIGDNNVE